MYSLLVKDDLEHQEEILNHIGLYIDSGEIDLDNIVHKYTENIAQVLIDKKMFKEVLHFPTSLIDDNVILDNIEIFRELIRNSVEIDTRNSIWISAIFGKICLEEGKYEYTKYHKLTEEEVVDENILRSKIVKTAAKLTTYIKSKNITYEVNNDNKALIEKIKMNKIVEYYYRATVSEQEKITKDIEELVPLDVIIEKIDNGLYRSKTMSD